MASLSFRSKVRNVSLTCLNIINYSVHTGNASHDVMEVYSLPLSLLLFFSPPSWWVLPDSGGREECPEDYGRVMLAWSKGIRRLNSSIRCLSGIPIEALLPESGVIKTHPSSLSLLLSGILSSKGLIKQRRPFGYSFQGTVENILQ